MLWLLLLLLANPTPSKGDGAELLDDLLMERSVGEAECDALIHAIAQKDRHTAVDHTPRLLGQWVSQQCETRDGPEYILRSISFFSNVTFQYFTHFYRDSECTYPVVSMELKAVLSHTGEYDIRHLRIAPQTNSIKGESLFSESCLRLGKTHHKHNKRAIVFGGNTRLSDECALAIKRQLPEMSGLVSLTRRQQFRKVRQLLLTDRDGVRRYAPPLLFTGQRHDGCTACHAVVHSSLHSPPVVARTPLPPPEVDGEWVSGGCETLPSGVHLTRRLAFSSLRGTWWQRTTLYTDPACTGQVASVYTSGNFSTGDEEEKSRVDGAYKLKMTESCSCMQLAAASVTQQKQHFHHQCSPRADGCMRVHHTHRTIFKLIFNPQGAPELLLGHRWTSSRLDVTSFQPALVQCTLFPAL